MPRIFTKTTTSTEIVDVCLDELLLAWNTYHMARNLYVDALQGSLRGDDAPTPRQARERYMEAITRFKAAHKEYKTAVRNLIVNHQL